MNTRRNLNEIKWTMCSSVIIGLLTHAYILYNKISYHDDIFCLYTLGGTYGSGRWSLGILGALMRRLFGGTYSAPGLNGILSILLIAVAATLIVEMFSVKNIWWIVATAGIMETIPVVTSTFSYMFTAPYYMIALVFAVLGAFLITRKQKWFDWHCIGAVLSMAVAVGIYQAYFAVTVSLVLSYLIWNFDEIVGSDARRNGAKKLLLGGIRALVLMALGMAAYALFNKVFLAVTHYELSDYRGVNNMFSVTFSGLLSSAAGTYKAFVSMFVKDYVGLTSVLPIRLALIILWILAIVCMIRESIRRKAGAWCNILYWGMAALLPLAFHIVNVMVSGGDTGIHTLMLYSLAQMFIFPIVILAKYTGGCAVSFEKTKYTAGMTAVSVAMAYLIIFSYAVVDNQAYMRVQLLQNEATAFYNRLITRIEGTEGYLQSDSIYIAGALEISDKNLTEVPQFPAVTMTGYTMTTDEFINDYAWKEYVRWQLGFDPVYEAQVPDVSAISEMPCYPDADSIRIVDDVVVVKFSDGNAEDSQE